MSRFRNTVAPRLVYVAPLLMVAVTVAVLAFADHYLSRYWEKRVGNIVVPANWLLAVLGASATGAFAEGSVGRRIAA